MFVLKYNYLFLFFQYIYLSERVVRLVHMSSRLTVPVYHGRVY